MKARLLTLGVMVFGIAIMLWAGWHNLRERRLAMQQARQHQVMLMPDGKGGGTAAAAAAEDSPTLHLEGKPAPSFTLVDLDGKKVSLAQFKGRPVLVNFWATWCAPCKLEMPWFGEFRSQYAAQGFEILGINEDPEVGNAKIAQTAHKLGASYPILIGDDKVAPLYGGIDYLPMSFYVDRSGTVVQETAGLGSKDEIEANIKKLVGAPVASLAAGER